MEREIFLLEFSGALCWAGLIARADPCKSLMNIFCLKTMANNSLFDAWQSVTLGLLICAPLSANSECSRVIKVPMSPIGLSVVVSGETVSGVYPDVLQIGRAHV